MASTDRLPRYLLDPTEPRAAIEAACAARSQANVEGIAISMEAVTYGEPAVLASLQRLGEEGRRHGKPVILDGVRPDLYKALYIAKIAQLFTRR